MYGASPPSPESGTLPTGDKRAGLLIRLMTDPITGMSRLIKGRDYTSTLTQAFAGYMLRWLEANGASLDSEIVPGELFVLIDEAAGRDSVWATLRESVLQSLVTRDAEMLGTGYITLRLVDDGIRLAFTPAGVQAATARREQWKAASEMLVTPIADVPLFSEAAFGQAFAVYMLRWLDVNEAQLDTEIPLEALFAFIDERVRSDAAIVWAVFRERFLRSFGAPGGETPGADIIAMHFGDDGAMLAFTEAGIAAVIRTIQLWVAANKEHERLNDMRGFRQLSAGDPKRPSEEELSAQEAKASETLEALRAGTLIGPRRPF